MMLRFLILICLVSTGTNAADLYTVPDVQVDVHASTAAQARDLALAEGQIQAFRRLVNRLTFATDRMAAGLDVQLETMDPILTRGMVVGLEIDEERRSATRYIGRLTISFDPRAVRRYLNEAGVPFAEAQARPRLVIPVFIAEDGARLWGENPWLTAWTTRNFTHELAPLGTPLGDDEDAGALSSEAALALDPSALSALADIYGAQGVIVAVGRDFPELGRLRVDLRELDLTRPDAPPEAFPPIFMAYERDPGNPLADYVTPVLADALETVVETVQEPWRRSALVQDREARSFAVTALYSSHQEWLRLSNALATSAFVQNARLDALSVAGATLTLSVVGRDAQLASELAGRGVLLERGPLGWTARLARSRSVADG